MAEKVVAVRLEAKVDGFASGMRKAKASVDDLTKAAAPDKAAAFSNMAGKAAIAGGAIALGIGVAISKFAEFDKTMSAVKANTGSTGAELDALRQTAMQLGADTQFSATEAAQGINEMAKAGVGAKDILGGGLKGALDLAAAGQLGVGRAAEIAATTMNQFGLAGGDVTRIADTLAAGANKAMGSVEDLSVGLEQVGPVAASMGFSLEETTGILAQFAQAGLVGEKGGTALRGVLTSLTGPSAAAAKEMERLGISMYDAQGNTLGAADMAEQLKVALEPLPDAERNAALARIFGNASMGAATILMKGGAAAAKEWQAAVTDSGFAAKQAAALTDNLTGDLERLGGAFDTAFIQAGSGANSGLRTLVQGLTGVVDIVGRIPGPLLLAGAGLASLALLAPKGILAWRGYVAQLDALGLSLDSITAKSPRAGAALKAVGAAGIVVGIAAVARALQDAQAAAQVADVAVDDLASSLNQLSSGGRLSGGIADIFRDNGGLLVAKEQFVSTGEAIERFATTAEDALSDANYNRIVRFLQPGATATLDKYVTQIDQALAQMVQNGHAEQAKAALDSLLSGIKDPQVLAAARSQFTQYAGAVKVAGEASKAAAPEVGELSDGVKEINQSAEDAKTALDNLKATLEGFGSPLADARAAERDFQAAVDDASAALKDNGSTLDSNSAKGRANGAALDAIRAKTLSNVSSTFALTGSMDGAAAAMQRGRTAFINAAVAAGMSKAKADALADALGLIPKDVKTQIALSGVPTANRQIDLTTGKLTTLDAKEARPGVKANVDDSSFTIADARLDRIARSRTANIRVTVSGAAAAGAAIGIAGKATGGPIEGVGTGTSDSNLILASKGEHMWTAAEVAAAGGHGAIFALRKAILAGSVARHASGGPVGEVGRVAPMQRTIVVQAPAGAGHGDTVTLNAYGLDADQAVQKAMRQWEFKNAVTR